MDIQDTLIGRNRTMGNMDCFLTQSEEKLELQDFPRGFSSLYNSPLYEGWQSLCNSPTYEEHQGGTATCGYPAQQLCISPNRIKMSMDSQIQQLKSELAQIRDELQMRERKRANSPMMQIELPVHLASGFEGTMTKRGSPRLNHDSEGSHIAPEVIAKEVEPEFPEYPFEEMKTVTAQATQNGREFSDRNVERLGNSDYFSPRPGELVMDNRSWVPSPEESGEMGDLLGTEYASFQTHQMDHYNEYCPDGELQVLKAAVSKLSHIFWEQEGKLKVVKGAANKDEVDCSQTTDLQPLYLELLKGLSKQLGELCHVLRAGEKPHERLVQKFQRMEMMDQPAPTRQSNIVEVAQQKIIEGNTNLFLKLESGAEHLLKVVESHVYDMTLESANLRAALEAAERRIEEQMSTNLLLTEKLDSGAKYLSKVIEEHAKEIERKNQRISHAQQLNMHLANDLSQTETSLAEIQSRYKGLVSSLESQLEAARKEAVNLQDTVIELKVVIVRKEDLVSTLEGEAKEHKLLIQELRGQMQAVQGEVTATVQEKVELIKGIQAMKKDADEINRRFKELISINENLIVFSQSKEDEIRVLTTKVKSLQQYVDEKSDEIEKMSTEAMKFSQEVAEARTQGETYRLRCKVLKAKLEETEQELLTRDNLIKALTIKVKTLQQSVDEKSDEVAKMSVEAVKLLQEVIEARTEGETYRLRCTILKSKFEETEQDLVAREDSIKRLTQHLDKTIEGHEFILKEKEQLLLSLNTAQYKERHMEDQVRESKTIIQDLEEKLNSMDADIYRTRLEMIDMNAKGQAALPAGRQAGEVTGEITTIESDEDITNTNGQVSIRELLESSHMIKERLT